MDKYKIAAIDADGTLLNSKSEIPAINKAAINKAQKAGVYIALCSGRSFVSLDRFAAELELDNALSFIISFNGGLVFNGLRQIIRTARLELETARYINTAIRRSGLDVLPVTYSEPDVMLCERESTEIARYTSGSLVKPTFVSDLSADLTSDVFKTIVFGERDELLRLASYMSENAAEIPYDMTFSGKRLLEFSSEHATKAAGLKVVCDVLGFDIAGDAVAIGDNFNDLSMIKAAALGCVMANADDGVKKYADYVTLNDNDNGGVAEVLERFFIITN